MRLPLPLIESPFFLFERLQDYERALALSEDAPELHATRALVAAGLPPITSPASISALFGINEGLVWSLLHRPRRHYRTFFIPKGAGRRRIDAPRVALKVIQAWMAKQFAKFYVAPAHVFGFVPGRSHIDAARAHLYANWVLSLDIQSFFPSTPERFVADALEAVGYTSDGARIVAALACFEGGLAQGAPTSPTLSNICFREMDEQLSRLANSFGVRLTRYADDITFSGTGTYPAGLKEAALQLMSSSPWTLSARKTSLAIAPNRLKVHGLLVHGTEVRLTKGYRNRLRAYRHLAKNNLEGKFARVVAGHVAYASAVEARAR